MAARAIKTNPTPPLAGTPWIAFAFLAIAGFTQYGLGAATPYLRTDLRLTAFEARCEIVRRAIEYLEDR